MICEKKLRALKIKLSKGSVTRNIVFGIMFVLFLLYAFSMLYAFWWGFMSACKSNVEIVYDKFSLPEKWKWDNYLKAFKALNIEDTNVFGMIFNSLWFTFGTTLISLSCCSGLAYVVCKYKFIGRNALYAISVVIMIIPIAGNLPAMFKLVKTLQLDNSPLILLTATGGFGFNFLVLYGFFSNLSWSYAEAALVDGASDMYTYTHIMLPQAMPAIGSLIILAAIGGWNDYMTPLLYLDEMPTLAVGLMQFGSMTQINGKNPEYYAALMMSTIPILVLFIIFQNTLLNNTVAGGLKG